MQTFLHVCLDNAAAAAVLAVFAFAAGMVCRRPAVRHGLWLLVLLKLLTPPLLRVPVPWPAPAEPAAAPAVVPEPAPPAAPARPAGPDHARS